MTQAFADAPLGGEVLLLPEEGSSGWVYAIDVDEDGVPDHEGTLDDEIAFPYRFTAPGVHRIHVDFFGPDGRRSIETPVVVNDPDAVRVLLQTRVFEVPLEGDNLEGIAVSRDGRELYLGNYSGSKVYRLDASTLEVLAGPVDVPRDGGGPEGLAVVPSDSLLLVTHKRGSISVLGLPGLGLRRQLQTPGEFFVHALDDTLALTTRPELNLVDLRSGDVLRTLRVEGARHFAVSPTGSTVAVLTYDGSPALDLATLPGLQPIGRVDLPVAGDIVAFHPAGDRAYLIGRGRFVVVDLAGQRVLRDMPIGSGGCGIYCVANPVAAVPSGRYVAMEQIRGTLFIDTEIDLPLYQSPEGFSVAASPVEDAFYLARPDGIVSKVVIEP